MATEKQIAANRANAQKSTGPQDRGWTIEVQPQRPQAWLVVPFAT
jgi:hypothetical protein